MSELRTRRSLAHAPLAPRAARISIAPRLDGVVADSFYFADFELDLRTTELRRAGVPLPLPPRSLSLLAYLIRQRARTVTREELFAEVWHDVVVTEGSLRQAIWEVRQVLHDEAGEQRYIRTVRGVGYRFVAEVELVAPSLAGHAVDVEPVEALLGRTRELRALVGDLEDATSRSGRAVLITGSEGVGKSRLLHELAEVARVRGVLHVESSIEAGVCVPPFGVCLQLLSSLFDAVPRDVLVHQLATAPCTQRLLESREVAHIVSVVGPRSSHRRHQLFEEMGRLLVALSQRVPLLVVVDDLQWVDETSLEFLVSLHKRLPRARLLLGLAARPLPPDDASRRGPLAAIARGALTRQIELRNFDVQGVAAALTGHGQGEASNTLSREVHALTLGSPSFTLEVVRLVADAPERRPRTLREADPIALRDIARRHLMSLPPDTLELARAVSVWGERCSLAELSALVALPHDVVLGRLDECVRRGVLSEDPSERHFGFSHPLLRDVAYEAVPRVERCRLHQRAGRWLEREAGASSLNELAHHFQRAAPLGDALRAVRYSRRAGDLAYAETEFASAVEQYASALRISALLDEPDPVERLEIELYRVAAQHATGVSNERVALALHKLAERATELGEPRILALVALALSGEFALRHVPVRDSTHVDKREIALLERALAELPAAELELRALLSCTLSMALLFTPERERCQELSTQGLVLARQAGRPALLARVLTYRAFLCPAPEAVSARRATCDELVELTHAHGLLEQELVARLVRSSCALMQLDTRTAAQDEARAVLLAEQLQSDPCRARVLVFKLWRAVFEGDPQEALRLSSAILAGAPQNPDLQAMHLTRVHALTVLIEGAALLEPAATVLEVLIVTYPHIAAYRCSLASVRAALGDLDAARLHFDWASRDEFAHIPRSLNWLAEMTTLADTAVRLACAARARRVYELLLPFEEQLVFVHGDALPAGSVARTLADLAVVMGELRQARAWLDTSRRIHGELGATLFLQYDALVELKLLDAEDSQTGGPRRAELAAGVVAFAERRSLRWLAECAAPWRRSHLLEGSG